MAHDEFYTKWKGDKNLQDFQSNNKLNACMVATCLSITLEHLYDDAETFLLNFLMYVQIASTDIYLATQNCIQNTASLQN